MGQTKKDAQELDVIEKLRLVKINDGKQFPFEIIEGGDNKPYTVTSLDENTGAVVGQLVTFEPYQYGAQT